MRRRRALVVGAGLAVFVLAGTASASAPDGNGRELSWRACHGGAECATLTVPLDDTSPGGSTGGSTGGPTIDLALVRYRAREPSERIGALVVNPGGPGASGVDFVVGGVGALPDEVRDRFDIVGFDPRGVGESGAVDCIDDLDPLYALDFSPETEAEHRALQEGVQQFVDACARKESAILPYVGTARAARDLDRIRAALGEDTLTYIGYSYGTYLGAWYAEQFPERVRALVLDGALDPTLDAATIQLDQARGFERTLRRFLKACARDRSCAFSRSGNSAEAFDRLRARIERAPLAAEGAGDGRTLNSTQFDMAVTQLLYPGRGAWDQLAESLDRADRGDGTDLRFEFETYAGLDSGTYNDAQEAFAAISCADGPPVGDVEAFRVIADRVTRAAPRLGPWIVNNSLPCALWPVAAPPPRALPAVGAAPIVVVGTTHDSATPLKWARGLAEQLDSGVLVTVEGSQHTSFAAGNGCVDQLVVHYLVDLEVPAPGTRC